ncbi:MAG TPA: hypothetical protein PLY51_15030 [Microthrixaceae bacterium]|nr:hypothetical protein [Microthrixaceae bacterium]
MARTSAVAALRDRLAEVTAERDRLRDAIDAISRHREARGGLAGNCRQCNAPWPCRTEQAHLAATQSTASAEDRAATDGAGSRLPHGEGPHDATSTAPGPTAEGTLPAPKDDHRCGPNCWGRCTHDPGAAL